MPLHQSHCLCRQNLELVAVARMLHINIAAASDNFCGQRIHCPKPGQVTSHNSAAYNQVCCACSEQRQSAALQPSQAPLQLSKALL